MIHVWESLLQEVEADSQAHSEIASVLVRTVSRHTLERTFHRKLQARKLLAHRESLDLVIAKAEETLTKSRQDYRSAYANHLQSPQSAATLAAYLDSHNSYVTQLHATNAMVEQYTKETLPDLLQVRNNSNVFVQNVSPMQYTENLDKGSLIERSNR
ncbi:hypothetical protein AAG570_005284 [Ranatra chinensis]|uniref:Uncharacterized protein n=1 Tax=Ranatra chinensis TaxID=642074 RepID=A0ABD0Y002_9HEMI